MSILAKWDAWSAEHPSSVIDGLRIFLGLFIFYKGLFFMQNTAVLIEIIQPVDTAFSDFWMVHYVAMSHLAGGIFIALGLLTRLAVIIQIPILLGAVIVNMMGANAIELTESLVSFMLLLIFAFYGSGRFSADHFFGIKAH